MTAPRSLPPKSLALPCLLALFCFGCDSPTDEDDPIDETDPRVEWIQSHAIPLSSVDPAVEDFTDLQPLADVLGDARIVFLGEQTHGEGNVFLAKTRLIKFLHQELGFDVLAFESGFYDVPRIWTLMEEGMSAQEAVPLGVFDNWTGSQQFQSLIDYLGQAAGTSSPLELTGFDLQPSGFIAGQELVTDLEAFLDEHQLGRPISTDWADCMGLLDGLVSWEWTVGDPSALELEDFLAAMDELRASVEAVAGEVEEASYWAQLVKSLAMEARVSYGYANTPADQWDHWQLRDAQMAENFLWLARERFPDRKIIGWLATGHAMRGFPATENTPALANMGSYLGPELGDDLYVVGFTAYQGQWGQWWFDQAATLAPPAAGSLEDLLHRAGLELAFLDLKNRSGGGEWLSSPISARPNSHVAQLLVWPNYLDALIYTRTVVASTEAAG